MDKKKAEEEGLVEKKCVITPLRRIEVTHWLSNVH